MLLSSKSLFFEKQNLEREEMSILIGLSLSHPVGRGHHQVLVVNFCFCNTSIFFGALCLCLPDAMECSVFTYLIFLSLLAFFGSSEDFDRPSQPAAYGDVKRHRLVRGWHMVQWLCKWVSLCGQFVVELASYRACRQNQMLINLEAYLLFVSFFVHRSSSGSRRPTAPKKALSFNYTANYY